jgi:IS30 family transposase
MGSGSKDCIVSLVERKSGLLLIGKLADRTTTSLNRALFYFARPYHSWERGSNENANGLIRQYLPRGASMAGLSQPRCNAIARKLNLRPRKRLGFRTPLECYHES